MNSKQTSPFYCSPLFAQYNEIFHGTTTKQYGPVQRDASSIKNLCAAFKRKTTDFISGQQTHGNTVLAVQSFHRGTTQSSTDGLVLRVKGNESLSLFLGVYTADCVPVFFYDPVVSIVGLCHAGWRGVANKIVNNMVSECVKMGSDPSNLRVCLGPHIRSCSYSVAEDRARLFEEMYGKNSGVVSLFDAKYYINLSEAIRTDLVQCGVLENHIDHDSSPCTYCDSDMFYSYRRRTNEKFSEMVSFIGIR